MQMRRICSNTKCSKTELDPIKEREREREREREEIARAMKRV